MFTVVAKPRATQHYTKEPKTSHLRKRAPSWFQTVKVKRKTSEYCKFHILIESQYIDDDAEPSKKYRKLCMQSRDQMMKCEDSNQSSSFTSDS